MKYYMYIQRKKNSHKNGDFSEKSSRIKYYMGYLYIQYHVYLVFFVGRSY